VSAGELTIAWTPSEAVLLGPDSRLVRQPLHPDEDHAAVILEAWRMEFPEALAARLLTGDPAAGPAAVRLAALAADAGLRLDGAGEARGARQPWPPTWRRPLTRRSQLVLLGTLALALGWSGWRWEASRQADQQRQSTADERSAELAADGRRRQETAEQRAAIAAACAVPGQFHLELLHRLAGAPAAVVIESVEIGGTDCVIRGQLVAAAPGAEGAVDALRRSVALPADRWQIEAGPAAGADFALHAVLLPLPSGGPMPPQADAIAERDRLPSRAQLTDLRKDWSQAWSVSPEGSEVRAGVELQRFSLQALSHDARAWSDVLQWIERAHREPGVSVERLSLHGSAPHTGALDRATLSITARARIE
jgi:hypothetical protein